jgi:hypothetical protein
MRGPILLLALAVSLSGCKSRDELLQAAEEKAKLETEKKARAAKGIGDALSGAGQQRAESLAKGFGEVLKGAERGLDGSLGAVEVVVAPELASSGLRVNRASRRSAPGARAGNVVSSYLVCEKAVAAPLELRALDKEGKEIGRAAQPVKVAAGGAEYVDFTFDERTPLAVAARYELRAAAR